MTSLGDRKIRAVLLDMGGVLMPTITNFRGAAERPELIERLRSLGVNDPGSLVKDAGDRVWAAYRALEPDGIQPDPREVLADLNHAIVEELVAAFAEEEIRPLFPYTLNVLHRLSQHYRLGLVSNTLIPGDHHATSFDEKGILRFFDAVVWSANFGKRKPCAQIFEHVLGALGVEPAEALFVGDKIRTDILGAHSIGMVTVWLDTPQSSDTGEAQPYSVLDDISGLLPLLGIA